MVMNLCEHSIMLKISLRNRGHPQHPLIARYNYEAHVKYVIASDLKVLCHRQEPILLYAHPKGVASTKDVTPYNTTLSIYH